MSNEIIKTVGLSKTYGSGDTIFYALKDVNIAINKGEFISIMGPSGSGKTTLMNMLGALDRPTSGETYINGVDTAQISERKLYKLRREQVGFIFQRFFLIPNLNALDNVLIPVLPRGINETYRKRAKELLEEVGLKDRMKHKPNQLSGGEFQRVAIARSMIMNPPIILADEPTGNLDSTTGAEVFKLMRKIGRDFGTTFVIVTHDPRVAKATDRIIFLEDGETSDKPTVDMNVSF